MIDLYRFFDADDQLLYVGISFNAAQRAMQHRHDKPWWTDVARMNVEHLPVNRQEAEAIERSAIVTERPLYNVTHNGGNTQSAPPVRFSSEVVEFDAAELWIARTAAYDNLAEAIDAVAQIYDKEERYNADEYDGPTRTQFIDAINGLARAVVYGDCCEVCDHLRYPIAVKFEDDGARCSYFCRTCHNQWRSWWTRDLSILGAC